MKYFFGVENLRSIDIVPPIELCPITILLGRNNVGKSSLLQTLPLLRQSAGVRTIGPIFWKGDFVDFGDFSTAVKRGYEEEGIKFSFECENFAIAKREFYSQIHFGKRDVIQEICINKGAKLQIVLSEQEGVVVRKNTILDIPELEIKLDVNFSNNDKFSNILVNNQKLPSTFQNSSIEFLHSEILSPIDIFINEPELKYKLYKSGLGSLIATYILDKIKTLTNEEISEKQQFIEADKILVHPRLKPSDIKRLANTAESEGIKKFYSYLQEENNKTLKSLDLLCSFHTAVLTYEIISVTLNNIINNSTYIGPMRARSKRFHEVSNIDVSELRIDGANLPAMLSTLEIEKLEMLSDWLQNTFGFGLYIERSNGHISVFVKRGESYVNFVDSGFGISQLVPIAVQVWWDLNLLGEYKETPKVFLKRGKKQKEEVVKVLTVEQPELHLHPAHQAKLADLFTNSVKYSRDMNNYLKPVYIIETHSEAMISRLGELIENGLVSNEDVQVLMFTKESDELTSPTTVKKINFDKEGYLDEWPYGFFRYKSC